MKKRLPCGREAELPADMFIDYHCLDYCRYSGTCGSIRDWLSKNRHRFEVS